jgi:hypothetical protein
MTTGSLLAAAGLLYRRAVPSTRIEFGPSDIQTITTNQIESYFPVNTYQSGFTQSQVDAFFGGYSDQNHELLNVGGMLVPYPHAAAQGKP